MTEPLVSVKMITYNHAPFIAQAIDGVLQQQTNFPFELVIGEDCSTDGTREIVFEYQKKYPDIIRVITSDSNIGMNKNNLRTTKACRGKYLAYCEGDDYWHSPHKLQKQSDYLEGHPECGLVCSSYDANYIEHDKKIKDYIKYRNWEIPQKPTVSDFVENRFMSECILTCTVMVRRNLHDKIIESDYHLHQSGYFLMGDTQLWAEIANESHIHYLNESLATYNVTGESASKSKDVKQQYRFAISCDEMFIYLCDKYKIPQHIRNLHDANWCDSSLRLAFLTRNSELADRVRSRKKVFTWKEWARYYGAKSRMAHYVYRVTAEVAKLFRRERSQ